MYLNFGVRLFDTILLIACISILGLGYLTQSCEYVSWRAYKFNVESLLHNIANGIHRYNMGILFKFNNTVLQATNDIGQGSSSDGLYSHVEQQKAMYPCL
jgi:hypothetical protein